MELKNLVVSNLVKYGNCDVLDLAFTLVGTEYEMPAIDYERIEVRTRKEMRNELKAEYLAEYKKLLIAHYKGDRDAKRQADVYAKEIKKL